MRAAQVIVGVDGSPHSGLTLRWAADEAARRGTALRIVHAYGPGGPDMTASPTVRAAGHRVVAAAVTAARTRAAGRPVTGVAVQAGAAATLVAAARPGDLLVVGFRTGSELTAVLAGSTCQQVALHTDASVVIVRGRLDPDGPVVVGYDGSGDAAAVVDTAFAAAAARECGLTVLRAVRPGPVTTDDLMRAVAPIADKYPDVPVHRVATDIDAAQSLVDVSHRASLVVVGTRGHGGFTGLLLGSVGLHLIHHAHCPVLIAR